MTGHPTAVGQFSTAAEHLRVLEFLDLSASNSPPADICCLAEKCTQLQELYLTDCWTLQDSILAAISQRRSTLRVLDISKVASSWMSPDLTLFGLASLAKLTELRVLNIANTSPFSAVDTAGAAKAVKRILNGCRPKDNSHKIG